MHGRETKEPFCLYPAGRKNTTDLNNKETPVTIWKGSIPAAQALPQTSCPLGEARASLSGGAPHRNGHVLPLLPDCPNHVSQCNRRFRAERFLHFKGVLPPPTMPSSTGEKKHTTRYFKKVPGWHTGNRDFVQVSVRGVKVPLPLSIYTASAYLPNDVQAREHPSAGDGPWNPLWHG